MLKNIKSFHQSCQQHCESIFSWITNVLMNNCLRTYAALLRDAPVTARLSRRVCVFLFAPLSALALILVFFYAPVAPWTHPWRATPTAPEAPLVSLTLRLRAAHKHRIFLYRRPSFLDTITVLLL